jgi:ankyrin repeat protein
MFFKRSISLERDRSMSLRQFVGFDHKLREWESKGWTAEGRGTDDMGLYTGLTVLHIAIANQSIDEVEMLLRTARADLRARATGAFFQPPLLTPYKDGKRELFSRIRKQRVFFTWLLNGRTMLKNAKSGFYAGELPLSFAASIGNIAIMQMLVDHVSTDQEKMSLIEATDSFGNTALHMAVYHNRPNAVDWLIDHGARKCMTMLNVMG